MKTPRSEIRQAFYNCLLEGLPIGPISRSDVAWPNFSFKQDPSKMYLAPYLLFGSTDVASLSEAGFERLAGVFQITIFGILNAGEAALERVTQDLIELFRGGTRIPLPDTDVELLISTAYGSTLQVITGGKIQSAAAMASEISRPQIVVSANWQLYIQKGA